ncbi:MAG: integral rane protein [Polaromonas sp.]|nr:integral rane protein [Polaromonas sp.]
MEYIIAKWLHILSSTLLFGTGIGSAYYLLVVSLSRDVATVAAVTRHVVRADWLFTSTTAVFQPLSGYYLMHRMGMPLSTPWILVSVVLYVVALGCWFPVVHIQMRLRDIAAEALRRQQDLPPAYWRLFRWWFALGVPAFFCFVAIFYLMVGKPSF